MKKTEKMTETLAHGYSWEYSARAIQWIPTWQGLGDFQLSLCPSSLGKSSLSIRRVKIGKNIKEIFKSVSVLGVPLHFPHLNLGLMNLKLKMNLELGLNLQNNW